MKKSAVLIASAMLMFGIEVPVEASEPVTYSVGTDTEVRVNYSAKCPQCSEVGTYLFEQPDGLGHIIVFRNCSKHGMYHHYV